MRQGPLRTFYILLFLLLALDQASKTWASSALAEGRRIVFQPDFFELVYVRNTGVAFGFLSGHSWIVVLLVAVLATCALLFARQLDWTRREPNLVGALLCAGALGNLLDRFRLGYVIDFIHVHAGRYDWPVFNVADSLICVAVGWLVVRQVKS